MSLYRAWRASCGLNLAPYAKQCVPRLEGVCCVPLVVKRRKTPEGLKGNNWRMR